MVRNAIVLGLVVAVAAIVFIVFGQMIAKTEAAAINAGGQADTYLKAGDTSYNITVPKGQTTFTLFPDLPDDKSGTFKDNSNGTVSIVSKGTAVKDISTDKLCHNLVLPDEINGKPVTSIDYPAFQNAKFTGTLTLPSSLQEIGASAF